MLIFRQLFLSVYLCHLHHSFAWQKEEEEEKRCTKIGINNWSDDDYEDGGENRSLLIIVFFPDFLRKKPILLPWSWWWSFGWMWRKLPWKLIGNAWPAVCSSLLRRHSYSQVRYPLYVCWLSSICLLLIRIEFVVFPMTLSLPFVARKLERKVWNRSINKTHANESLEKKYLSWDWFTRNLFVYFL